MQLITRALRSTSWPSDNLSPSLSLFHTQVFYTFAHRQTQCNMKQAWHYQWLLLSLLTAYSNHLGLLELFKWTTPGYHSSIHTMCFIGYDSTCGTVTRCIFIRPGRSYIRRTEEASSSELKKPVAREVWNVKSQPSAVATRSAPLFLSQTHRLSQMSPAAASKSLYIQSMRQTNQRKHSHAATTHIFHPCGVQLVRSSAVLSAVSDHLFFFQRKRTIKSPFIDGLPRKKAEGPLPPPLLRLCHQVTEITLAHRFGNISPQAMADKLQKAREQDQSEQVFFRLQPCETRPVER